jgi:ABC-type antimicrobial peptide transport system permease subunit
MAEKYFPNSDPIGKTVKVSNTDPFVITGVLQDIPSNSSLQFDWLIPFDYYKKKNDWLNTWGNYSPLMYVQLADGAVLDKVNAKLKGFLQKEKGDQSKDEVFLQSFRDVHLFGKYTAGKPAGGRIEYVRLFSLIAAFVLLIACINFMNLSTARSTKRMKEVGIRKVVGASRQLIIFQFLGEAFLLTLFSVALSLLAVELSLPAFNTLIGKTLRLDLSDPAFQGALVSIILVTGLVAGSYPAFFLSSFKPVLVLKSMVARSGNAVLLRKGLVVFQFTLSILLIVSTIIVSQQISFIRNKNIGIDKEHLLTVAVEGGLETHADAFKNELSRSPGISGVTGSGNSPIAIYGNSADLDWPGKAPNEVVSISATAVGYDYLKTIGVPLVTGRDFSRTMADSNNYVINESAVRLMQLKDPVGQSVSFWNGKGHIIGVVKDFHIQSLHEPITPLILSLQPGNASVFLIRTEKGQTQQAIASLRTAFQKYNPDYPFEFHFMDQQYEEAYKSEKEEGHLVRLFAVIAILISCLGLFGLAAFTAEQRTKEIGIRKVLGASVTSITTLLSKEFVRLVGLSILIATPIAWWAANSWLSKFAYRISVGWSVFLLAGALALLIALVTVSFQAIKAALANPIKGLRTE